MSYPMMGQVFRYAMVYLIVGVPSVITGYVLGTLGWSVVAIANTLIVPIGVSKFFLYKHWVFKNNLPWWLQEPFLYITIALVGYASFIAVQYGLTIGGFSEWGSFGLATLLIGVVRFLLFRRLFTKSPPTIV